MKLKNICFGTLFTGLVALAFLLGNVATAGANEPGTSLAAQESVSINNGGPGAVENWFTYQGYLEDNGAPVNDNCDFQFSLWDSSGSGIPPMGGIQIGTTETAGNLAVSAGLFSHTLNTSGNFGADAFNGQLRYLQIAARCPAGGGSYTTLAPRQLLTGSPYALSLRPGAVISATQNNALLTVINTNAAETLSGAIARAAADPPPPSSRPTTRAQATPCTAHLRASILPSGA